MIFDYVQVYRRIQDLTILEEAQTLESKLLNVKNSYTLSPDGNIISEVIMSADVADIELHKPKIAFSADGTLSEISCDCNDFAVSATPCKHILALAKYSEVMQQKRNALSSPRKAVVKYADSEILSFYQKLRLAELDKRMTGEVEIEPFLVEDHDGLKVKFRLGKSKKYIIKSIFEFVDRIRKISEYRYGQELSFIHSIESFGASSAELLRVIIARVENENVEDGTYGYYGIVRDGILFGGEIADLFFEMHIGDSVELKNQKVKLVDSAPEIKFTLKKKEDVYFLENSLGVSKVYYGTKYVYILADELYRCDIGFFKKLEPIFKEYQRVGFIVINEASLTDFCTSVLPYLESVATLDSGDIDLERFKLAELKTDAYLDYDERGITIDVKSHYGDKPIDVLDDEYFSKHSGDIVAEQELRNLINKYFVAVENNLAITDEKQQFTFLKSGMPALEAVASLFASASFSALLARKKPTFSIGVKVDSELLSLSANFGDEYSADDIATILSSYRQNKKFVAISGDRFVDLEGTSLDDLAMISESMDIKLDKLISGETVIPKYRAMFLNKTLKDSAITSTRDSAFKEMIRSFSSYEDSDIEPKASVAKIMRHYQKVGFRYLMTLSKFGFGGILADDMGLGKSLQAIAFIQYMDRGTSLIVCPSSLVLNWQKEFVKFAPEMSVLCIVGDKATRQFLLEKASEYSVVITSYDLLKKDLEIYEGLRFCATIIDEAQYIKNHYTLVSRAVKGLKSDFRFALTGTPIENSLAELWSIFDFIMPNYLFSYHKFKEIYETKITKDNDEIASNKLHTLVAPFILRRLKKDVLKELPDKIDNLLTIPLELEQKDLYVSTALTIRSDVRALATDNKAKFLVLSYLTKLRQICCSPELIFDNYAGNSAKLEASVQLIEQSVAGGHKILLFSQFTSMLAIIERELKAREIPYFLLTGDTKRDERMRLVDTFNVDATPVFLLSLKAGGTGLNLTGADIVVHYDPWWNVSVQNQATDRAHRIGQTKSVQVYRLVLQNTIEEKIVELQAKKQDLFDTIIREGEVDFSRLTAEQILDLLG